MSCSCATRGTSTARIVPRCSTSARCGWGPRTEKFTEIIAGVLPGEVVATKGSDVLRAELLKNNLGEGCCCGK